MRQSQELINKPFRSVSPLSDMPSEFDERAGLFKPASKSFKYESNPYERELLNQKKEQVNMELANLKDQKEKFDEMVKHMEDSTMVSPSDMDPTQNSNVKWFESATESLTQVEKMTKIID